MQLGHQTARPWPSLVASLHAVVESATCSLSAASITAIELECTAVGETHGAAMLLERSATWAAPRLVELAFQAGFTLRCLCIPLCSLSTGRDEVDAT